MSQFFVVGNGLGLIGLAWTGRLSLDEVQASLLVFPAAALGYWTASRTAGYLPASLIRWLVLVFSALGALMLIYRAS